METFETYESETSPHSGFDVEIPAEELTYNPPQKP
jgi:hypothetical protein